MTTRRDIGRRSMHVPIFHRHRRHPHRPAWAQVPPGHPRGCSPFPCLTPNGCLNLSNHNQGLERHQFSPHRPLHRALPKRPATQLSSNRIGRRALATIHQHHHLPLQISNGNAGNRTMIQVDRRNGPERDRDRTRQGRARIRTM